MSQHNKEALLARRENILDMGLTFAAMIRLFEEGSKNKILNQLADFTAKLETINSQNEYTQLHQGFCYAFSRDIQTASKKLKNGKLKPSKPASFGQAAKVLDIVLKVYIHYASLPSESVALKIKPFLHGPIDTPILKYLQKKYSAEHITATTIESIDEPQYIELQRLISSDIRNRFNNEVIPVEFDDIIWKEQNR